MSGAGARLPKVSVRSNTPPGRPRTVERGGRALGSRESLVDQPATHGEKPQPVDLQAHHWQGATAISEQHDPEVGAFEGEDTDAELTGEFWEISLLRRIIANSEKQENGPTCTYVLLKWLTIAYGIFTAPLNLTADLETTGLAQANALLYLKAGLHALGNVAFSLVLVSSYRALCPGGALESLGVATVRIRAKDAASLRRWRVGLDVLALAGTIVVVSLGIQTWFEAESIASYIQCVCLVILTPFAVLFILVWWLTLRIASMITRDEVIEVIKVVDTTDPSDEKTWATAVGPSALALDNTFKQLAHGWGIGLQGAFLCLWFNGLANFTHAVNATAMASWDAKECKSAEDIMDGQQLMLVLTFVCATIPFGLLVDVATTSSFCDKLMETLNSVRIRHYAQAPFWKLNELETALRSLHRGQGLGLILAGNVMDRQRLTRMLGAVLGSLTTVYTLLLGLGASTDGAVSSSQ